MMLKSRSLAWLSSILLLLESALTSSLVAIFPDIQGHSELYQRGHCSITCLGCSFAHVGSSGETPHPQPSPAWIGFAYGAGRDFGSL